jgi:hypothetical protein
MAALTQWIEDLWKSALTSLDGIKDYLPLLGAALLLIIVGWFIARLLRTVFIRLGDTVNRVLNNFGNTPNTQGLWLSPKLISVISNVIFWVIILIFAELAARTARLDAFSTWLEQIVKYIPTFIAGSLIALVGYLVSTLVRDIVSTASFSAGSTQSEVLGVLAQSGVFLIALVFGLEQIGINVSFLTTLLAIVVGGISISLAFAFGFGAREFVANLIAARHAQSTLQVGNFVRIGEAEGQILEMTSTGLVLQSESGRSIIPAQLLQSQTVYIITGSSDE